MASRTFHRQQSLTREVKTLHGKFAVGASGAPTLDATLSMGIESVTRDSAGVYIITLEDRYNDLLDFHPTLEAAAAEDLTFQVESETVNTTKTITFQCKAAAVETDPSNGSTIRFKIELKNTNIK